MPFRKLLIALICLGIVASATAQVDPDPDGIGVYFDPAATLVAAQAFVGEIVPAYLVLTRPSQSGTLALWEAHVGPVGFNATVHGTAVAAFNMAQNMPGSAGVSFACGMDEPYPGLQTVMVLAELEIAVLGGGPVGVAVGGVSYDVPYYRPDDFYHGPDTELFPASGSTSAPVAVVNGAAPVGNELRSWGQVKALYR